MVAAPSVSSAVKTATTWPSVAPSSGVAAMTAVPPSAETSAELNPPGVTILNATSILDPTSTLDTAGAVITGPSGVDSSSSQWTKSTPDTAMENINKSFFIFISIGLRTKGAVPMLLVRQRNFTNLLNEANWKVVILFRSSAHSSDRQSTQWATQWRT